VREVERWKDKDSIVEAAYSRWGGLVGGRGQPKPRQPPVALAMARIRMRGLQSPA
jgi:hypothetical protein